MRADGSTASGRSLIELEPEPRQLPADEPVEELPVLLGAVRRQRFCVGVAHACQLLGACFDQVEEVTVALFRLLTGGAVVGLQRGLGVMDEACVLALEHLELALDQIDEAPAHLPRRVWRNVARPRGIADVSSSPPTLDAPCRSLFVPGTSSTGEPSRRAAARISSGWFVCRRRTAQ